MRCRCRSRSASAAIGLLGRRALLPAFHRPEHLARVDPEHQRADQRDDDRAAAELAATAARKAAAAASADVDAAGIERIEPHDASVPLCALRKRWTGPANRAWSL